MWFYVKDKTRVGPISEQEISRLISYGVLNGKSLVFKKGMKQWTKLEVTELGEMVPKAFDDLNGMGKTIETGPAKDSPATQDISSTQGGFSLIARFGSAAVVFLLVLCSAYYFMIYKPNDVNVKTDKEGISQAPLTHEKKIEKIIADARASEALGRGRNKYYESGNFIERTRLSRSSKCQAVIRDNNKRPNCNQKLLNQCRIPFPCTPMDIDSILIWWTDDDGYADLMFENLTKVQNYMNNRTDDEVIEGLVNIALNSRFLKLRNRAFLTFYYRTRRHSSNLYNSIAKEVLRRELEYWEKSYDYHVNSDTNLTYLASEALVYAGEYDYAHSYLMNVNLFEFSIEQKDLRAIPFMQEAMNSDDDLIKVDAALGLYVLDADRYISFVALTDFLDRTNNERNSYEGRLARRRKKIIKAFGEVGDERSLPALNRAYKIESGFVRKDINDAIREIKLRKYVKTPNNYR